MPFSPTQCTRHTSSATCRNSLSKNALQRTQPRSPTTRPAPREPAPAPPSAAIGNIHRGGRCGESIPTTDAACCRRSTPRKHCQSRVGRRTLPPAQAGLEFSRSGTASSSTLSLPKPWHPHVGGFPGGCFSSAPEWPLLLRSLHDMDVLPSSPRSRLGARTRSHDPVL